MFETRMVARPDLGIDHSRVELQRGANACAASAEVATETVETTVPILAWPRPAASGRRASPLDPAIIGRDQSQVERVREAAGDFRRASARCERSGREAVGQYMGAASGVDRSLRIHLHRPPSDERCPRARSECRVHARSGGHPQLCRDRSRDVPWRSTTLPARRQRSASRSSVIASAKYSCSG